MSEQAIATRAEAPLEVTIPLTAVIAAEWQKFRSVRSVWIIIAGGFLFAVGFSILVSWVSAWSFSDWPEGDRNDWDPASIPLAGLFIVVPITVFISTYLVTSEMSSGMIRQTYLVTPQRPKVVLAKAVTASVVSGAFSALATLVMFVSGQIIFEVFDVPRQSMTSRTSMWLMIDLIVTSPIMPWFCCCIAFVLRNTAVSVMAGLAFIFGPAMVGLVLPSSWQNRFIAVLPAPASDAIAMRNLEWASPYALDLLPALLLTAFWLAVATCLAILVVNRRDA
jgi:ABC-type transport system involved in multi-copper enzyme maturation permease subunit